MVCLKNLLLKLVAPTRERERESKRLRRFVRPLFRFVSVVFIAFVLFLPQFPISLITPVKASTANWYDTSYKYRRSITIDNSSNASVLTNYEAKVTLSSSNFDFTKAQSSGQDIRFTDNDGTTLLNHWIEAYDNGGQTATVYVQVPSLSASSTRTIYVYYGNSSTATTSNIKNTFNSYIYSSEWSQGTVDSTQYSAFPVSIKLANGDVLVCYTTGASHSGNDQKTVCSRSTDGGVTYTSPTTIWDTTNKVDGPSSGLQLANGDIVIGLQISDINDATTTTTNILRSTDDGSTWQNPVLVTNPLTSWLTPFGTILQLSNGNLLMTAYGKNTGETTRSILLQSTDNGATWTLKSTIAYNASKNYSETSIVQIDSNNYVAAIREDFAAYPYQRMHLATSSDGGNTWTTPTAFLALEAGATSPNLLKLSNGHLVLTYGVRSYFAWMLAGIFATTSSDNGTTWGSIYQLFSPNESSSIAGAGRYTSDIGYPSSIQLPSGKIVTSYYSKTNADLTTQTAATVYRTIWTEDSSGKISDDLEAGTNTAWTISGTNTGVSTDYAHTGNYSLKELDGNTDRPTTLSSVVFNGGPADGEVNLWFYPVTSTYSGFDLYDYRQNDRFSIYVTNTGVVKYYSDSVHDLPTATTIPFNEWTKFTLIFHSTTMTVLVNDVNKGTVGQYQAGYGINYIKFSSNNTAGTGDNFYVDDIYTRNYIATDPPATVGSENSQISSGVFLNNDPTGQSSGKTRITGNANTGNSLYTVSDIQYSVNGGGWNGATATDGSFNSPSENFYLDFLPTDNSYNQDGYTIRVKAQSSSGVWQDNLFYFQPFNLDSPSNNSFTSNSLPTFGFSINKGEYSNLKDNLSKFQVLINKDNKGWQTYIDNIPVDCASVQNNGDNLQMNSLSTNGNGVYENNKIWVSYSNNNSSIQVYSKAVDSLGNSSDKYFHDGGHKLDSGSYQWKAVAVDKSGHSQETETRKLRVSSKQFNQSQAWFPLTIDFISGIGKLDLSTIHPQDVKDQYFTSYLTPTIKGIANVGTTVTLTKDTDTYTAVTGTDSRYAITLPVNSLLYDEAYAITLSVKDSGDNYNELPAFKLGIRSLASDTTKVEQATGSPTPKIEQPNQPTPTPKQATAKKHCFLFICW